MKEITIDGVVYVPKSSQKEKAETFNKMKYVIVRTYSAGVFAGYLEKRTGKEAIIRKARKLWYWDGAATLAELAVEGVSKPATCKFPCEVDKIEVTEVIEILDCTKKAQDSINAVPIWTMKN
jgi:hypothetical protein